MSENGYDGEINGEIVKFTLKDSSILVGDNEVLYSNIKQLDQIPDRGTPGDQYVYFVEFNDKESQEWTVSDPEGSFESKLVEMIKKFSSEEDEDESEEYTNIVELRKELDESKEKVKIFEKKTEELELDISGMKIQISQLQQEKEQLNNQNTKLKEELEEAENIPKENPEEKTENQEEEEEKEKEEVKEVKEETPEEEGENIPPEASTTPPSEDEQNDEEIQLLEEQIKTLKETVNNKDDELKKQAEVHGNELKQYREQLENEKRAMREKITNPEDNPLETQLRFYKNKLAKQNEDLLMLRQQMMENDLFRESSNQKAKEIQSTFKNYETKINDLECKYRLQKTRCERMVRAQGNFIRKFRDETLKSITSERDIYWQSKLQQTEKDLRELRKKNGELSEDHRHLSKKFKTYETMTEKTMKKLEVENSRMTKEVKKYYDGFLDLSHKNKELQATKKTLLKENRQLHMNVDRQSKLIDRDRSMNFYYQNIYNDQEMQENSNGNSKKKKRIRRRGKRGGKRKTSNASSTTSSSSARRRKNKLELVKKRREESVLKEGKITMANLEDLQQGRSPENVGKVMKSLDVVEEDRLDVSIFDTEKNKIKVENLVDSEN